MKSNRKPRKSLVIVASAVAALAVTTAILAGAVAGQLTAEPAEVKPPTPQQIVIQAIRDGVTIVPSYDPCGFSETESGLRAGCYYSETDRIEILPTLSREWTIYVLLHELAHHNGIDDECEADRWAVEHGATFSGYDCPLD